MLRRSSASLATLISLAAAATASAQPRIHPEVVLNTNDAVPVSGSVDSSMQWATSALDSYAPSIDANGRIAFWARLATGIGGVVTGTAGTVWYGGPGNLSLVMRYGDPTLDNANCGGSGAIWTGRDLIRIPMSPGGDLWLGGYSIAGGTVTTSGTSADAAVIWTGRLGNFHNMVRQNDVMPASLGGCNVRTSPESSSSGLAMLNNAGQTPLSISLREGTGDATPYNVNTGNNYALCVGTTGAPSTIEKVVRWKDTIIGTGTEVGGWNSPTINHDGSLLAWIALRAGVGDIAGTPVSTSNDDLLVLATHDAGGYHADGANIIAREGQPTGIGDLTFAPATGLVAHVFDVLGLNNSGRALWSSPLAGTGVTSANNSALFTRPGLSGPNAIVVRKGDTMFGIAPLASVTSARLTNANQVAWTGTFVVDNITITTANDTFLVLSTIAPNGTITHQLLVREGDAVPGLPGVLFGAPTNLTASSAGLLFQSTLTGAVTTGADWSEWLYNISTSGLREVAREGDPMEGIVVFDIKVQGNLNGEGSSTGINDEGWLAFTIFSNTSPVQAATFRYHIPCGADLDDGSNTNTPDGGVDINDLLFFLSAFEAGSTSADLSSDGTTGTPDGGVDINDLLFFLAHFEAGC